jgi:hypothetical protein
MTRITGRLTLLASALTTIGGVQAGDSVTITTSKPAAINAKLWNSINKQISSNPELFTFDDRLTIHSSKVDKFAYVDGRSDITLFENILKELSKKPQTDYGLSPARRRAIINRHFADIYSPLRVEKIQKLAKADPSRGHFPLLYECACFAGRMQPFRKALEDTVINHLENQVKAATRKRSDTVVITEFASGKLFPLFVLINRLVALGYTSFAVNGLDLEYSGLVQYATEIGTPGTLNVGPAYNLKTLTGTRAEHKKAVTNYLLNLNRKIDAEGGEIVFEEKPLDVTAEEEILFGALDTHRMYEKIQQFVGWFAANKNISLTLTLYADTNAYGTACSKDPKKRSDIFVALDYYPHETLPIFEAVANKCLKPGGIVATVVEIDLRPFEKDNEPEELEYYFITIHDGTAEIFRFDGKKRFLKEIEHIDDVTDKPSKTRIYHFTETQLIPVEAIPPHRHVITNKDGIKKRYITQPRFAADFVK